MFNCSVFRFSALKRFPYLKKNKSRFSERKTGKPPVPLPCRKRFFPQTLLWPCHLGIQFDNVVDALESAKKDEAELSNQLPVIAQEYRRATTSHAVTAYLVFKLALAIAPPFLLFFVFTVMIGSRTTTWGIVVLFGDVDDSDAPLFQQTTYCYFPHPPWDNRLFTIPCEYAFKYKFVAVANGVASCCC